MTLSPRSFLLFTLFSALLGSGSAFAADKAKPDLARATQLAENQCGACHSADGNSLISENPKLAGQHPEYLFKQLNDFKAQGGKPAARPSPMMAGMVAELSEADMRGLAVYFSQQKLKLGVARDKATVEMAQKLWRGGDAKRGLPACAACHGPAGSGLPAQYPSLQGQHAAYTAAQLKQFRLRERTNDPAGMMQTIAEKMTDREINAMADYISGLR